MEWLSRRATSALLAALLLASAAAADASSPTGQRGRLTKCSLAGKWVNDLGSTMHIWPPDEAGAFSGSYLTNVSSTNHTIKESPLYGAQHNPFERDQPTFGFVVLWNFSVSTATFVGQCFVDKEGVETLETLWLLRQEVPTHDDDWKATLVGKNVFKRIK